MEAIKIYSCYLHSTPTHINVACFHALNRQSAEIITPMSADRAPTRTNITASTTRSSETRRSDASNDVPGAARGRVRAAARSWHPYRTYYFSNKVKKTTRYLRVKACKSQILSQYHTVHKYVVWEPYNLVYCMRHTLGFTYSFLFQHKKIRTKNVWKCEV